MLFQVSAQSENYKAATVRNGSQQLCTRDHRAPESQTSKKKKYKQQKNQPKTLIQFTYATEEQKHKAHYTFVVENA